MKKATRETLAQQIVHTREEMHNLLALMRAQPKDSKFTQTEKIQALKVNDLLANLSAKVFGVGHSK
jgi:hypothetical protein